MVALVLAWLLAASGWLFAAGQQAERLLIHARAMDEGFANAIPDLLGLASGDVVLPIAHPVVGVETDSNVDALLLTKICASQVVVIARARMPQSFMTANRGWLYTEWPFEIVDVIKGRPDYGLRRTATIAVLQSGGAVTIEGRRVTAPPPSYWPDVATGSTYMLFLDRRIEETGAFRLFDGVEIGARRAAEGASRHPQLRHMAPEQLKTRAVRQALAADARRHCAR